MHEAAALHSGNQAKKPTKRGGKTVNDLDVLIVGAGISGIGAGYYLKNRCPGISYAILEARGALGGTWDLFRYPGIRSDSDLHTFGYAFKPWENDKAIAGADAILAYLNETARENGIDRKIRYHHKVVSAAWQSEDARWHVEVERTDTGERLAFRCRWIFAAAGYYRYDQGYRPRFEGEALFKGQIVHPQHWPEDLDYSGKRVVVIGSGATAVTLVPAMAGKAAHVTMLQRTPTYILSLPSRDAIANGLRKVVGKRLAYTMTRRKNIFMQRMIWLFCQRYPNAARRLIRNLAARQLPEGFPVDVHFNPPYNPWDQRLCVVPDGDLFKAICAGTASIATGRIRTFTENGVLMESGEHIDADLIVTATGLNLQPFGAIPLTVDGRGVKLSETVAFKGMMLSGVPNLAFAIGYTNSSWTLKIGLLCEHFCRLLSHMEKNGYDICCPEMRDPAMVKRPLLDFGAGYIQRSLHELPKQGPDFPWLTSMSYAADVELLTKGPVADPNLRFSSLRARDGQAVPASKAAA
jgi:cation diffusion facilitator CzcD-associated flavoprotein CzcO